MHKRKCQSQFSYMIVSGAEINDCYRYRKDQKHLKTFPILSSVCNIIIIHKILDIRRTSYQARTYSS
jgi:hypothetical protein